MQYAPLIQPWPAEFAGKLPVMEIFSTLQGEGRFAGWPAVFIRLKYCNLGCAWCDTKYSWETGQIEPGELLETAQIAERSASLINRQYKGTSNVHMVLTGGEPMLHQDRLPALIANLRAHGFSFVEIETNGMFAPTDQMRESIDWWNCSPKLSNNGLDATTNVVPGALAAIAATGRADFKFVIRHEADVEELRRDFLPLLPADRIVLMPEGWTRDRQLRLMPTVLELSRRYGFRFSPRLHILAYGNERGR